MVGFQDIRSFLTCAFRFKKTTVVLMMVLMISSLYWFKQSTPEPVDRIRKVEVKPVTRASIEQTARFIGVLKSSQSTVLFAKNKGILHQLAVSGSTVKKDASIAVIDSPDVVKRYHLAQQEASLQKMQYKRAEELLKSGVYSKIKFEEIKLAWLQTEKRFSEAKSIYDDLTIKAPFSGVLGVFKVKEGSSMQEGHSIISIFNPKQMVVEFDVPLSVASRIQIGGDTWVHKKKYPLTHIQKMLDEETHMCPAYVNVDCVNCIAGAAVDVDVVVSKKENVMTIPFEAIFLRNGESAVYVVEDGKATLKMIEIGLREKNRVEVTKGLKEGEKVITRGQSRLYPGAAVQF